MRECTFPDAQVVGARTELKMKYRAKRVYVIFALLLSVLAFSCGQSVAGGEGGKTVTLTDEANGGSVQLAPGDVLVVRLEARLGTGYGWSVAKCDSQQLRSHGDPEQETPPRGEPNAKEYQVFRFSALAAGKAPLELHYARPWEKGVAPLKTFHVEVEVK